MTQESPFFLTKVECPICKTINEYETIKLGAYTERDRDTDFRPTDRTWRNPRYQAYDPLLYFTATCSNCLYTREFTQKYKDWKDDSYFKTYRLKVVKQKHLELLAGSDSVIKMIGQMLDSARYPSETAVLKLILAVIDENFNDKQNDLDLGRFYLRIGWLFRGMDEGIDPNEASLKGHLLDISKRLSGLRGTLEGFNTQIEQVKNVLQLHVNDDRFSNEVKSQLMPLKDKYDSELDDILATSKQLEKRLTDLNDVSGENLPAISKDSSGPGYCSYADFSDFLGELSRRTEGIPVNEKQALTYAVDYYKKAFKNGKDIGKGNQQIQASYLIAELSRRIGAFEQAKEYFNTTIRAGQEFVYRHRNDQSRTAMARKILELAIEQGRDNLSRVKNG